MQGEQHSVFGKTEARQILNAGWRQGSIFRPPEDILVPVQFDRDHEVLVVCTQSCTVVSPDLIANPHIEYLVAEPVDKYHPKSDEAKGKNSHCFHLPIFGMPNIEALRCDINRRFFVDRRECIRNVPENGVTPSEEGVRNLAGWISRYYTRIALPDELVARAKVKNGLFEIIQKTLRVKDSSGDQLSDAVDKIYITWSPDSDLQGGFYEVKILFLCADTDADDQLHALLDAPLDPFTHDEGHDGIKLLYDTKVRSTAFIIDFDGYKRLTEWDYLSNLGDVAEDEA
jgi:hypothetical protein